MIVVAGEALIDLVGAGGGYRAVPGGSPANVAVTLARLGRQVRLLARLSGDPFGQQIRAHLSGAGVDLGWTVPADEPTSLAVATLDQSGRASYQFYLAGTADWQWTPAELPALSAAPATAVHSGSLALAMAPGAGVLETLFAEERARDAVTLSLDLNLRPSIVGDRARERQRVERQLRLAHLVKASEEDLAWLYPDRSVADVMADWRAAGVTCSVVTLGAAGSRLLAPDGTVFRRPARSIELVDTVGAGDAFTGGLLAALDDAEALGDRPADRLASVPAERWPEILDHADAVAALTCTRRGADPPTRAEVDALGGRPDPADRLPTAGPVS